MRFLNRFRIRNCNIILQLVLSAALLLFSGCDPVKTLTDKRIKAVENGLLKAVVFEGENPERMKLAERMTYYKVPGVSIAVIDNYQIEWAKGYREAGTDIAKEVTPATIFQAAELSQAVAAAGVITLLKQSGLDLDAPVNEHLRTWKLPESSLTREKKISVRHILSHCSGIISLQYEGYEHLSDIPQLDQVLKGEKSDYPPVYVDSLPEQEPKYSEAGYAVLEKLVEDLSGQAFTEFMARSILQPLQMDASTFETPLSQILYAQAATGYTREGSPIEGKGNNYPVAAARGLWASPSNLAKFAIDLMRAALGQPQTVISPAMAREMLSIQCGIWGLGLYVGDRGDDLHFYLHGRNNGFSCFLVAYPVKGQGAVIMTNSDNGEYLIDEICRALSDAYQWPHFIPEIKKYFRLDPSIYQLYEGTYEVTPEYRLIVSYEDYYLLIQPTGQIATKFFVENTTTFFSTDPYIQIRFVRDNEGNVTGLVLRQGNFKREAKKIE
jgi:CubicO group peptidase (beta-lactamase class C family)